MDLSTFLANETVKQQIKSAASPLVDMVYNEVYVYVWIVCIYCIFLLFLLIVNMFLLINYVRYSKTIIPHTE